MIPDSVNSLGDFVFAKVPLQILEVGNGLVEKENVGFGAFYDVYNPAKCLD